MRRGLAHWAASDRPAGPRERDLVLRQPARGMTFQAASWTLAAVIFGTLNAEGSVRDGLEVAASIALGGLVTSAAVFLIIERVMRPAVALVLSSSPPPEAGALGVGPRILLTWLLVAGAPLIAVALLAAADEPRDPAAAIAFVVGVALVVGAATVMLLGARGQRADPGGAHRDGRRGGGRSACRGDGRRRERGGSAAGGVQRDGGRPARARAPARPLRATRRRRRRARGARARRRARRAGARG